MRTAGAFGVAFLASTNRSQGQVNSVWNGGVGLWSDANQWTPNSFFPNNGNGNFTFNASIGAGLATLDVPISIANFTLSGGATTGTANLTVNGNYSWTAGTLGGSGNVAVYGNTTITIGLLANATLATRFLNYGYATVNGEKSLDAINGAEFVNAANGTLDLVNGLAAPNTGVATLTNHGHITSAVSGTTRIGWQMNALTGSTLQSGLACLSLTGGGSFGTGSSLSALTGATLGLDSNITLGANANFTGPGTLRIGGNVSLAAGDRTFTGPVQVNGDPVAFFAGTLTGPGNVTVNGPLTMHWGNIATTGTVTANGNFTTGGAVPVLAAPLILNANGLITTTTYGTSNSNLTVSVGQTLELQPSTGLAVLTGTPVLNVSGTVQKTLGSPDAAITWQFNTSSTGVVRVETGRLIANGGGTWANGTTVQIGAGANLHFNAGSYTLGNVTVASAGAMWAATPGGFTVNGNYTQTGNGTFIADVGLTTFNGNSSVGNVSLSGTWNGTGNVAINGNLTWHSGTLGGNGTTTLHGTTSVVIPNTTNGGYTRTIVNNANAIINLQVSLDAAANSLWINSPGSLLDLYNGLGIGGPMVGVANFTNSGTVQSSSVGATHRMGTWTGTLAGGTIQALAGCLAFTGGGSVATGGIMAASAGATLGLDSTFTLAPNANFTGPGTLRIGGNVTLAAGNRTFDGPVQVNGNPIAFFGGNLSGPGNVTINAPLTLFYGSIVTTGTVTANANLTTSGSSPLLGAPVINNANGAITTSTYGTSNSNLVNSQAATLEISPASGLVVLSGTPVLNNSGTVQKTLGNSTSAINWTFNNANTALINVQTGILTLGNGGTWASGTTITVGGAASGDLQLIGGTFALGNTSVSGNGTVTFSTAGGATINGTYTHTGGGRTRVTSGVATFNGNSSLANANQTGGYWIGTGNVTINGNFGWSGGILGGTGTTTLLGNSTIVSSDVILARPLINNAATTMSDNIDLLGNSGITWTNNGSFNITGTNNLAIGNSTVPTFNNNGLLTKTASSGTSTIAWIVNGNANSTLSVLNGNLTLAGGGNFAANSATTVANGTTLQFSTGNFTFAANSSFISCGTIRFGGSGATTTLNGDFSHTGSTSFLNGTTILNGAPVTLADVTQSTGSTLRGSANLTINGLYNWQAGNHLAGGGFTTLNGNSTLGGTGNVTLARTLTNNGNAVLASGGSLVGNAGAVWNNANGAVFDIQSNRGLFINAGLPVPAFNNNGTFRKSLGNGTSSVDWNFVNNGTLQAQVGTLSFSKLVTNNGIVEVSTDAVIGGNVTTTNGALVRGGGTLSGEVAINIGGRIAPGTSLAIDTLTVGNITLAGNFIWKIADAGPNTANIADIANTALSSTGSGAQDSLNASGSQTWTSANLTIVGLPGNGFDDTRAYSWRLGTYGTTASITATTISTTGFAETPQGTFSITSLSNTLVLNYDPTPIPEPTSILLVSAAGFGLVGWQRRRGKSR